LLGSEPMPGTVSWMSPIEDQQSWMMAVGWNLGMAVIFMVYCKFSEKLGLEEAGDLREFCVCLQYEEAEVVLVYKRLQRVEPGRCRQMADHHPGAGGEGNHARII